MSEHPSSFADLAVFRPVRSGNAFEEAVERILQAIKLGVVPTGERLPPERELSARLGVSRMTLREAIRALQQAGYVESRRGRFGGTFVAYRSSSAPHDPDALAKVVAGMSSGMEDVLTYRWVLEVGAARAAAARTLTARDREHLVTIQAEVESSGEDTYRQLDSRLHLAIAEITGSPSLASALADNRMRVNELLDAIPLLRHNIEHSHSQHRAIVQAILSGNADQAGTAMAEHLEGTAALLRGFLS
ncbi:FadR/GntR family transcriptional regulator [Allokutzneria oryzae]|uniref:FadR/GntR family transcriptional regulator n=1 Tax=Allokutzneria oryzae TaxID=1378989 RepID=A0ABV5ZUA9_9PSEU